MSGRRRAYPQPQYATGPAGMATPPAPNQFQQQQPVQQPVQQYGVDQMQGQFQQMNVGGVGPT